MGRPPPQEIRSPVRRNTTLPPQHDHVDVDPTCTGGSHQGNHTAERSIHNTRKRRCKLTRLSRKSWREGVPRAADAQLRIPSIQKEMKTKARHPSSTKTPSHQTNYTEGTSEATPSKSNTSTRQKDNTNHLGPALRRDKHATCNTPTAKWNLSALPRARDTHRDESTA